MIYLSKVKLNNTAYVANLSGGKDSLAKTYRLMEEEYPLTHVVFYDTGMEFRATYNNIDRIRPMVEAYGAQLVILRPESNWLVDMLIKPVKERDTGNVHYGYEWCGGCTRWRTSGKIGTINKFLLSLGNYVQYIGIAADEPDRIKDEANKCYPLVEWEMTEKKCLDYCYEKGFHWQEDGVELYSILKRVSCWCCGNKNLEELRNMYHYLPYYWELLKGLQSRIDRPFYGKYTVFELEERFRLEDAQMSLFDFGICDGNCGTCGGNCK